MAGTVTSSRITDKNFYFTYRNLKSAGLLADGIFDVSRTYTNGWKPAVQQTTSFRSGKSFSKALSDPQQSVADEDLLDLQRAQGIVNPFVDSFSLPPSSKYDRGHPFSTTKVTRDLPTVATLQSIDGKTSYHGPIGLWYSGCGLGSAFDGSVSNGVPSFMTQGLYPSIDLGKGTLMIHKTIPTLPVSGAAAFLGELHEGLPRLIGHSALFRDRAHVFHGMGNEYLNVEFGWKPFVSDLKDFAKAFKNAGKILAQYRRDSGKTVHRHWQLPPTRDVKVYPEYKFGYGGNPANFVIFLPTDNGEFSRNFTSGEINSLMVYGTSASAHSSSVIEQKYKFSGAYSYLLSEDDSFFGRMERYVQEADKLFGVRLTPDVLWQLTPWSWLADWESNIGVNISNMTALGQDNLVLRWGYLMRETSYKHYISTSNFTSYGGFSGSIHSTWRSVRKERVRSTPYGFGLNTANFTDRQWSILGALGMTRAPRSLF